MIEKYKLNFNEFFCYDETSPTCLRWIIPRMGAKGKPVSRQKNGIAGSFSKNGSVVVNINGGTYSVKKIVWLLHDNVLIENRDVISIDGDCQNCKIENLRLNLERDYDKPKYSEWLSDYFYYDETSPSFLRWKTKYKSGSKIKVGDIVGTFDPEDEYWRTNSLGESFKIHRIIWTLFNGECPEDMHIDHIDGNRQNNNIKNLRIVTPRHNMHNKSINKNNNTGVTGVAYAERYQPSGEFFSKYVAHNYIPGIGKRSRSFSIQKYGDEEAFKLACECRDKMIEKLNKEGADYTDRHGT